MYLDHVELVDVLQGVQAGHALAGLQEVVLGGGVRCTRSKRTDAR